MSGESSRESVRDMLAPLRASMTVADIARSLDRSPRMVRKILAGDATGENLRGAVSELRATGEVSHAPERRRGADGHTVPVRDKGGRTRTPDDGRPPAPARPRAAGRGRRPVHEQTRVFRERVTDLPGGTKLVELGAPKGKLTRGRERANAEMIDRLRSAARGQRHGQKRVKFVATTSDGRSLPVGDKSGYAVSDVLRRGHGFSGDALGWLKGQAQHRYAGMEKSGVTITGVTMTIY